MMRIKIDMTTSFIENSGKTTFWAGSWAIVTASNYIIIRYFLSEFG